LLVRALAWPLPLLVGCSSTRGVSAPLNLVLQPLWFPGENVVPAASSDGETERGVEKALYPPSDPRVAAMEGDAGGSGDRVK
jgi:hypothetical protein